MKYESDKENILPVSDIERSFAKSPEIDRDRQDEQEKQEQYFQKKQEKLFSLYNFILDQEEKISENLNNDYYDKEIQEIELFWTNEMNRMQRTKMAYYTRRLENESYKKLLSETGFKQLLLEALIVFDKPQQQESLCFKLKNNYIVEVGVKDDASGNSQKDFNKLSLDEDEDKGELAILSYVRDEHEAGNKLILILFKFLFMLIF